MRSPSADRARLPRSRGWRTQVANRARSSFWSITIYYGSGRDATTNGSGVATFTNLTPGTYNRTVITPGSGCEKIVNGGLTEAADLGLATLSDACLMAFAAHGPPLRTEHVKIGASEDGSCETIG